MAIDPMTGKEQVTGATQEARHIANLGRTGYTGTFASSDKAANTRVATAETENKKANAEKLAIEAKAKADEEKATLAAESNAAISKLSASDQANLDTVAAQMKMSKQAAFQFLNKKGQLGILQQNFDPEQMDVNVDPLSKAWLHGSNPAFAAESFSDPEEQALEASRGGLASFNVQNMYSNMFAPGGSGAAGIGIGTQGVRQSEDPLGISGLGVAAPGSLQQDPMLSSFMDLPIFSNASTQERQSIIEQLAPIFAMLTGATSTEGTPGPQTQAYRFRGGY